MISEQSVTKKLDQYISSELVELRSISDRIAIISDGKLSGILKPDDSDADFGLAMSGTRKGGMEND